ncbi:peptide chain release factor N(5)-glutamine methyltransferase [bacterium]|nr:peptide chain release factor N(5)-glutamine methyltransferase [bacterium]
MNIKQITQILINGGIEINEAKIEAKMLAKSILGLSDVDLLMKDNFEEFNLEQRLLDKLVEKAELRANTRMPIQHIIGKAYFMGEDFIVNKNVLIPRDETEILVRKCIEIIKEHGFKNVLDMGTGSGCIACIIAKETTARVLGADISNEALEIALDNSSMLNLFNKAIFRKSDLFSNIRTDEKFDLIVSNPPYIPKEEDGHLQKEVEFDPKTALFASDKDGVEFYEKISREAPQYLNENGYLAFELGVKQSELVEILMKANGFKNIQIIKDLAGINRVILGNI